MKVKSWRSAVIACGFALGLMIPVGVALADSNPHVISPNDTVFGYKYSQWSAQWWQFVLSIPADVNPLTDESGSLCVVGQHGPVWFLMGAFGGTFTRTCSIPEGKTLFFPVLNLVDINVANQTAKELRAEIAPCMDAVSKLSVAIDGDNVQKLQERFRVQSEVFEVAIPESGFLDPGIYSPAVDDGYYVMLEPLKVGKHTLHIVGESSCGFGVDVTYHLAVVPVKLK